MMIRATNLETLLNLEKQTPNDDTLLSQIAFYYLQNPDNDKELEYFKKAYEVNPSIKNTHNYAFWANGEYGEDELALALFKELMDKNPKSFYPYMAYAQFLLGRTNLAKDFQFLKSNVNELIDLYQKAHIYFKNAPKNYQDTHHYELVWICNNLANVYLVNNELENSKIFYQSALQELENCFNDGKIQVSQVELDEYRYFILYNLLILAKIEKNKNNQQVILKQLKECQSFDKYDIFYLKRKKANRLKRQLHYFYKCWLFGCEHCGNLFDDNLESSK